MLRNALIKVITATVLIATTMLSTPSAFAQSSSSVKCDDGKTYTATVSGGSCSSGKGWASCSNAAGDAAQVNCDNKVVKCSSQNGGGCSQAKRLPKATAPVKVGGVYQPPTNPPPKGKGGLTPVSVSGSKQTGSGNQTGAFERTNKK